MIKMRHFSIFAILLFFSEVTWSHAMLRSTPIVAGDLTFNSPIPRDTRDGYKLPLAVVPCGNNVGRSPIIREYQKGQMVKFEWLETIQHQGIYVLEISADNGLTFTKFAQFPDNQDNNVLPHLYSQSFPLPPALVCNACIIRFVQQMSNTGVADDGVINLIDYFSCADVKICLLYTSDAADE